MLRDFATEALFDLFALFRRELRMLEVVFAEVVCVGSRRFENGNGVAQFCAVRVGVGEMKLSEEVQYRRVMTPERSRDLGISFARFSEFDCPRYVFWMVMEESCS